MKMEVMLISIGTVEKMPVFYGEKLFPKRMEKTKRFLKQEDRLRSAGAGILLHEAFGIPEKSISYNEYQKPLAPDIYLNLSHSGDYVIGVTDEEPVGCDIEIVRPFHPEVAGKVFLPEELCWMEEDPIPRFYILWTLKESVMKQQGLGFSLPPETFSVLPLVSGEGIRINGSTLYANTVSLENYRISVCATRPVEKISYTFYNPRFNPH